MRHVNLWTALAAFLLHCLSSQAIAQLNVGGVYIDADGVLREASALAQSDRLQLLRTEVVEPAESADLAVVSPLRKVSLRRLEQAVEEAHAARQPLPAEVRYLAGLQQVRYVLFY